MTYKKKLIEVALPLDVINAASGKEKSIRHGHPSTLHLWWARRPLAACRAVLFSSLIDDPSERPDLFPTEKDQDEERKRLFTIIEELVAWENTNNKELLDRVHKEIQNYCGPDLPRVYDPFSGGGSIPLEAQRLGLSATGSDLNPVAVLISKALIEIPVKFKDRAPVNPHSKEDFSASWTNSLGMAEDIRFYGQWIRNEAEKKLKKYYPDLLLPKSLGGTEAKVIAWIWARTVASPNPAAKGKHVPLVRSFVLSKKGGKTVWTDPVIKKNGDYEFEIRNDGKVRPGTVSRASGQCILTGSPISAEYIKEEGRSGRLKKRLMALVVEYKGKRIYLAPSEEQEDAANSLRAPSDLPETDMPSNSQYSAPPLYGMTKHKDLFTVRQQKLLSTFCDLIPEVKSKILNDSGNAEGYANAIVTYLGLGISKIADYNSSLVVWSPARNQAKPTFSRQAFSMVWDFAEVNPFAEAAGDLSITLRGIAETVERKVSFAPATAIQADAANLENSSVLYSTDPPYYDNVPYADLSDFFYIWLRRCLQNIYPSLFSTVLVPKSQELVADVVRHNGRDGARAFFEHGIGSVFQRLRNSADRRFPITIYYAFKQTEEEDAEDDDSDSSESAASRSSTGWETFLQGVIDSGWQIDGTWPIRTERGVRTRSIGSNALASSIVLVCRHRPDSASVISRRDFLSILKKELPESLRQLQKSNIAPVDFAQSAIGPAMSIFSRYSKILESDDSKMSVKSALILINQVLDETFGELDSVLDPESRWAINWFENYAHQDGLFGDANTLAQAKNVAIDSLATAGIVKSKAGKVSLVGRTELSDDWFPRSSVKVNHWLSTQHLIHRLLNHGEDEAAVLLRELGEYGDVCRDLAYRCFSICERKGWTQEAIAYNSLVLAWPEIRKIANNRSVGAQQSIQFGGENSGRQ
jgi:putative DNA methylase